MTVVRIPPVLRASVGGIKEVPVSATNVGQALAALIERFPNLRDQLMTPEGDLNRFVNVYLDGQDVRYLQALETPVGEDDSVVVLPAMAGG